MSLPLKMTVGREASPKAKFLTAMTPGTPPCLEVPLRVPP
jgi:hypothetical protein